MLVRSKCIRSNDFKFSYGYSQEVKEKQKFEKAKDALIHSGQGFHYKHLDFQKSIKRLGLHQSIVRRENCWDNAPQEPFFGHLKDEASIKTCTTLDELRKEIKQYMIYYNYYIYQWNLKKKTSVQYRDLLLNVA